MKMFERQHESRSGNKVEKLTLAAVIGSLLLVPGARAQTIAPTAIVNFEPAIEMRR